MTRTRILALELGQERVDAKMAPFGGGCSFADEQDEKSAWADDRTGSAHPVWHEQECLLPEESKYRLLDIVEEYVPSRALLHVVAALMTVASRKLNMAIFFGVTEFLDNIWPGIYPPRRLLGEGTACIRPRSRHLQLEV